LLTDAQMQHFIAHGYLVLKTTLPAEFHQQIYQRTEEVFAKEGNPGNNLLPRIPQIKQVFDDPVVIGALTSVLGQAYLMHSHRHPHINPAGGQGGGWHKDSYWGYRKVRHHRCRWAMIFYYPQDVTQENGPTGVMPGTHCYEKRAANEADEVHLSVTGPAGTAVLVHFDIWHRATPNLSARNRYMMKFQFTRMQEPMIPTWNAQSLAWTENGKDGHKHPGLWARLWEWHCGGRALFSTGNGKTTGELVALLRSDEEQVRLRATGELALRGEAAAPAVDDLAALLRDPNEPVRLNAAYALGAAGKRAVPALVEALSDPIEEARLAAAYGLGAAGRPAIPSLLKALEADSEPVRGYAAHALGDMGRQAGGRAARALAGLARDPSAWVRRIVAEALGYIARDPQTAVPALRGLLKDEDPQARYEAAYGLARFGRRAAAAVPDLVAALRDENRYVSGHSASALQRIDAPQARQALLEFLSAARWCPATTKESTY
jgi:hypothetical protein